MLIATVYDLRMVFDLKKEKRIDNEEKCEKLCQKLFMDGSISFSKVVEDSLKQETFQQIKTYTNL